jgi:hypothetical protein
MLATLSAGSVLAGAVEDVNNFGDTRGGALAGPMGLFVIIVLAIATVLLIRNMNKRLRRLPSSFPREGAEQGKDRNAEENDNA